MSADVDAEGIDMGPDEFAGDDGARFKPADVDAAREALLSRMPGLADDERYVAAFEAAIRADERRKLAEEGYGPLTKPAATGRAK